MDNIAPQIQVSENTYFMEERVVDTQTAYPQTKMELSKPIENEMSDDMWLALDQLKKPVHLGTYDWSVQQAAGTNIYERSFPQMLNDVESLTIRTLRMYAFYKMSPIFRVQINSTPFHQGQLLVSFDPFSISSDSLQSSPDLFTPYYAIGLPHVRMMASNSDPIELKVPFTHPRSFLTTNVEDVFNDLGKLRITVYNPLVVAEGTKPTVSVSLWVYANEASVHVPIYDHNPILEPTSGVQQNPTTEQTTSMFGDLLDFGKGLFNKGRRTLGNVLTGNFGQAARDGYGLVGDILGFFGLDYPVDPISPTNCIMPVENMAVAIGKSRAQRLALDPFSMHKLDDQTAGESIESMDLKKVLQIPMKILTIDFDGSDATGSPLAVIPVHPIVSPRVVELDDVPYIQQTYLSYISQAFVYWNGGIKYDLEFVATRFHSGRLLIAFLPNEINGDITYDQALVLPNVILDLQQTSHFTFTIPYTSSTAMKSTFLGTDSNSANYADAALGTMYIFVHTALTYPANVASSVQINLYAYGSEDFGLYVPRKQTITLPLPPTNNNQVEATSGISVQDDTNAPGKTEVYLSKGQNISRPRPHFGEKYTLIDLIRRYSQQQPNAAELDELIISPYRPLSFTSSTIAYWSQIYSAWSGSLRYKFIFPAPRSAGITARLVHRPDPTNLSILDSGAATGEEQFQDNGYAYHETVLSQNNALEVDIPYYSKYNMLLTRQTSEAIDFPYIFNGTLLLRTTNDDDPSVQDRQIFVAAGEDFRFIYLRPPPVTDIASIYSTQG